MTTMHKYELQSDLGQLLHRILLTANREGFITLQQKHAIEDIWDGSVYKKEEVKK